MRDPSLPPDDFTAADKALLDLLRMLDSHGYRFVTPTPATHAHVVSRPARRAAGTLEDVLGWSLPFRRGLLPGAVMEVLDAAGVLVEGTDGWRSTVRVSSLDDALFLHSAYPTTAPDAVFLGPDSYRFAAAIHRELARRPLDAHPRIADIGTGAGVGAIIAARLGGGAEVTMTDINPAALRLARINAAAAGVCVDAVEGAGLDCVEGRFDLVTINPPFIIDPTARAYRHGGGMHGAQLSLDLARAAMGRLAPAGRVILYTGSAIVSGRDALRQAVAQAASAGGCALDYREIDPDVFGEELAGEAYADVDRIALVTAVVTRA